MVTRSAGADALVRTRVNWGRAAVAAVVLLVLLAALMLLAFRLARPGVLRGAELTSGPGTSIAVGQLSEPAVSTVVQDLAGSLPDQLVEMEYQDQTTQLSAADLGLTVDVNETVEAVLSRGRQANPIAALRDHLTASFTGVEVLPVVTVDEDLLAGASRRIAREVGLEQPRGSVAVSGSGQVRVELPPASEAVDTPGLARATLGAMLDPDGDDGAGRVALPTVTVSPEVDEQALALLEADAERAMSAPVTLTSRLGDWTIAPDTMAGLLAVGQDAVNDDGVSIIVDPEQLQAVLPFDPVALTTAPTDASFDLSGGTPQLVPSGVGFVFDIDVAATQVTELATSDGPRSAPLRGREIPPDLTGETLASLGVETEVSTFTTDHACCEGRVQNIQRIADLVDGALVRPGETFSLNAAAGPRTPDNGFVEGGAIDSGEFVEQVGGGVSQFTTTLFNAVFFGGYEINEFQPHSYYIPRYPLGREATLNFDPPIDFSFTNDAPHAILISTSYTDTSVTVILYSSVFAAVESSTSDRYGFRDPEEERRPTPDLPAGEERVQQAGSDGFSVDFTRDITYVDGRREEQTFTTVYRPQPRIMLVGTGGTDAASEPEPATDDTPAAPVSDPTDRPSPSVTVEPVPDPGPVDNTPEPVPDQPGTSPDPALPPEPARPPTTDPPAVDTPLPTPEAPVVTPADPDPPDVEAPEPVAPPEPGEPDPRGRGADWDNGVL